MAVIEKEMKRSSLKPFDIFRVINIYINLYEIEETWVCHKTGIMGLKKCFDRLDMKKDVSRTE